MRNQRNKRLISGFLAAALMLNHIPVFAAAEETGLCEHHTAHVDCGYEEGVEGSICTYECTICFPLEAAISGIEITQLPFKTQYAGNEQLNVSGGVITVSYDDDTAKTVEMTANMVSGFESGVSGIQTLTVQYEGFETSFDVEVIPGKSDDNAENVESVSETTEPVETTAPVPASTEPMMTESDDAGDVIEVIKSDLWGDNLTWTLYSDGRLVITGTGEMTSPNNVFEDCKDQVVTVEIAEGITTIGERAFSNCKNLTAVSIPDGVTSIGFLAFSGCENLAEIDIPESVVSIEGAAFQNCRALTQIDLPAGMAVIESGTFQNCSKLVEVSIPSGVTEIGERAFSHCENLSEINLPDAVSKIGENAFYCSGLTAIVIPAGVESIGDMAFGHCTSLKKVTFLGAAPTMGEDAFYNCHTCYVYYPLNDYQWPDDMRRNYGGYLIWYAVAGDGTVLGGKCGDNAYGRFDPVTGTVTVTGTGDMYPNQNSVDFPWSVEQENIRKVIIGDGITSVPPIAFSYCVNLTSVSFPVTAVISGSAFGDCTSITEVIVTGSGSMPDSDSYDRYYPWFQTEQNVTVEIREGVTGIGANAFFRCDRLVDVTLPDSLTEIGDSAFQYCTGLTKVTVPDSVHAFGWAAFGDCTGLTEIDIPVTAFEDNSAVFRGCSGIRHITVPEGVTALGNDFFSGWTGLSQITLPDTLTSIGSYALAGCTSLTEITIPAGVTSIGDRAFQGDTSLSLITFLGDAPGFGFWPFANVTADARYPHSNTTWTGAVTHNHGGSLRWSPFLDNGCVATEMWLVSKPEKLLYFQNEPLDVTGAVLGVRYSDGTEEEVPVRNDMVLNFDSSNVGRYTYEIYYLTANMGILLDYHVVTNDLLEGSCGPDAFWKFDPEGYLSIWGSGEITEAVNADQTPAYPWTVFKNLITSVDISGEITKIPRMAFVEMLELRRISLPETLMEIGSEAFSNCKAFTYLRLPDSLKVIGFQAFNLCDNLENITWGSGLTEIGELAFQGCSGIQVLEFPKSLVKLGDSAFSNCTSLTTVKLPEKLTEIASGTFLNCPELSEIVLPEGLTTIGTNAFSRCSGLSKLEFPQSLTRIDAWAFSDCTGLNNLVFPENVGFMGQMAFQNCIGLNTIVFTGSSPNSMGPEIFDGVTAIAYYPANRPFAEYFKRSCGGNLDWQATGKNLDGIKLHYPGIKALVAGDEFTVYATVAPTNATMLLQWSADYGLEVVSSNNFSCTFRVLHPGYFTVTATDTISGLSDSMSMHAWDPSPVGCPYEEQINLSNWDGGGAYLFTPEETRQYTLSLKNVDNSKYTMGVHLSVIKAKDHSYVPADDRVVNASETYGFYTLEAGVDYIIRPDYRGESYMDDVIFRLEASAELTGIDIPEESMTISLPTMDLGSISEEYVKVNFLPANAVGTVTWHSSDTEILEIYGAGCLQAHKPGTVTVTALCGGFTDSVTVTIEAPRVLSLGVKTQDVCEYGHAKNYAFTAPKDGTYTFAVEGSTQFWISMEDAMEVPGGYYRYIKTMKAGETAYLHVDGMYAYADQSTYTVLVRETVWAKELHLGMDLDQTGRVIIHAGFNPWNAEDVITQWSVSDETKLWAGAGDPDRRYYDILNPGEVTVTVTSLGGLTASVTLGKTSGVCGENASWNFDPATGTLTVSGTGEIVWDYSISSNWEYYHNQIAHIVIEEGITDIDYNVFHVYRKLRSIRLPGSLKTIGDHNFSSCANLTSLTLPEGLESIGEGVFQSCGITTVSVPVSLKNVGEWSFNSDKLTDVYYAGNHTQWSGIEMGRWCGLLSADVHYADRDGTEETSWFFDRTTGTLTVSGTGRMENFAVNETPWENIREQIQSVVIGEGITSVGHYAFFDCGNLKEVTIPATVTYIGRQAFDTFEDGLTIYYGSTEKAWENVWREYNGYAFENAMILFADNSGVCGIDAVWRFEPSTGTLTVTGTGKMRDYSWDGTPWISLADNIRTVVVSPGITRIGDYAFEDCGNLTSVTLPDGLLEIGDAVFRSCTALKSIAIPSTVTGIEDGAFSETGIREILIPAATVALGHDAFWACYELRAITVEAGNPAYLSEDGVLFDREKTTLIRYPAKKAEREYTVPESVRTILDGAFEENHNLERIQLPTGLETIGGWAFQANTALKEITIPDSVTSLGYGAFADCSALERAVVGKGVRDLQISTFGACSALTEVVLPDTLVNIWEQVFGDCVSLKRIVLPAGMTFVSDGAFYGCSALEEVVFGGIREIYAPFYNCRSLKKIHFLSDAPDHFADAFDGLTLKIYYPGANPTWTENLRQSVRGNITWVPQYDTEEVLRIGADTLELLAGETATLVPILSTDEEPEGKILWALGEGDSQYVTLRTNLDGTATVTAKKITQYQQISVTAVAQEGVLEPAVLRLNIIPVVSGVKILSFDDVDITGTTQTLVMGTDSDNVMVLSAENSPAEALQDVVWKSSNVKYAEVDEYGVVTGKIPGKIVTITASAADGSGKKATVRIKTHQPMEELLLPETAEIAGGKTLTMKAEIAPQNTTNPALVWEILEGEDFAVLSATGKLKTRNVDQMQTVVVRVSAKEDPELYAECSVDIYPAVTKVQILNEEDTVVSGTIRNLYMYSDGDNTMQLYARNDPEEAYQEWNWKSSAPQYVSVVAEGILSAHTPGKIVTITATAADGSGKKASVVVRTIQPMEDLILSGPTSAAKGKRVTLTAQIWPENTTNQKLLWEITDGAEYASVSSGKVKARTNFTEAQTITVRASAQENPDMCAYFTMELNPVSASAVNIYDADGRLVNGTKQTLVMDSFSDNTLTLYAEVSSAEASQELVWKSSNTDYATVDESGTDSVLVPGKTVTITAATTDGSGKKAAVKVTGKQPVEMLMLQDNLPEDFQGNLFVAGGKSLKLAGYATVYPENATSKLINWSVEENVHGIRINKSTGILSTSKVTEMVTVLVTAQARDGFGADLQFFVNVYPATTELILQNGDRNVTGMTLTAKAGTVLELDAVCTPENAAGVYDWKTSNPQYAEVEGGRITLGEYVGKTVTIQCVAADGSGKKATVKIKIVS